MRSTRAFKASHERSKLGIGLGELAQFHGERHIARDLELALHKSLLCVQFPLHQRSKVLIGQLDAAVRLGSRVTLSNAATAVLEIHQPGFGF